MQSKAFSSFSAGTKELKSSVWCVKGEAQQKRNGAEMEREDQRKRRLLEAVEASAVCVCVCCVCVCVSHVHPVLIKCRRSLVPCWQCMCTRRRSGKALFASSMTPPPMA